MNHRKLSAGETAGTYRITDTVTEAELLSIAKAFARRPRVRHFQPDFGLKPAPLV